MGDGFDFGSGFDLGVGSDTDPFGGGSEFGVVSGGSGGAGINYNTGWGNQPQGNQWGQGGTLGGLAQLLGIGLGGGGLIASLLGQGGSQTQTPRMSGTQIDALNALRGNIASQNLQQQQLFNQGAGMLQNLQGGQIPAGLSNLVQGAYGPTMQNLGQSAIEASQRAGFALPQDALTGGPGSRIMGQGLAQLPGQMAQTTLNTMFPLISALMGAGQQGISNLQGAFNSIPGGSRTQQDPSLAQRFQQTGPFLQGIGNVMNPPQINMQLMNPITGLGNWNGQQRQGGIPVAGQQQQWQTGFGGGPDIPGPFYYGQA